MFAVDVILWTILCICIVCIVIFMSLMQYTYASQCAGAARTEKLLPCGREILEYICICKTYFNKCFCIFTLLILNAEYDFLCMLMEHQLRKMNNKRKRFNK